jgi:hypothetical protein
MTPPVEPDEGKEPAEGSRETVDQALQNARGRQQGITNRPLAEELDEQSQLPPRGHAKDPGADGR